MILLLSTMPQPSGSHTRQQVKLQLLASNSSSRHSGMNIHRLFIPPMKRRKVLPAAFNHNSILRNSRNPPIRHNPPTNLLQFPARHQSLPIRR